MTVAKQLESYKGRNDIFEEWIISLTKHLYSDKFSKPLENYICTSDLFLRLDELNNSLSDLHYELGG